MITSQIRRTNPDDQDHNLLRHIIRDNWPCAGDKLHVVHCLPGQPVDVLGVTGMGVPVERLPYKRQQKVQLDHARRKLAELYSERMAKAGVRTVVYVQAVICEIAS